MNYKVKVHFFHSEEQHVLVVWLFLLLNLDLISLYLKSDGEKKGWPDSDLTMKSIKDYSYEQKTRTSINGKCSFRLVDYIFSISLYLCSLFLSWSGSTQDMESVMERLLVE